MASRLFFNPLSTAAAASTASSYRKLRVVFPRKPLDNKITPPTFASLNRKNRQIVLSCSSNNNNNAELDRPKASPPFTPSVAMVILIIVAVLLPVLQKAMKERKGKGSSIIKTTPSGVQLVAAIVWSVFQPGSGAATKGRDSVMAYRDGLGYSWKGILGYDFAVGIVEAVKSWVKEVSQELKKVKEGMEEREGYPLDFEVYERCGHHVKFKGRLIVNVKEGTAVMVPEGEEKKKKKKDV